MIAGRRWVRVTTLESVPLREGRAVTIGGLELALFNLGVRVLATANRCPHRGGPLCDGIVSGAAVVCPLHAWKIDLGSGEVQRPGGAGACVETYPARVEEGVIVVSVPVWPETSAEYVAEDDVSDGVVGAAHLVPDAARVYRRPHDEPASGSARDSRQSPRLVPSISGRAPRG
jgi:nitrite reductase (NADH) small subunit